MKVAFVALQLESSKHYLLSCDARFNEFMKEKMWRNSLFNWTSGSLNNHWSCCQNGSQLLCQNLLALKNSFLWQFVLVLPLGMGCCFFSTWRNNEGKGVVQKWKREDKEALLLFSFWIFFVKICFYHFQGDDTFLFSVFNSKTYNILLKF